MNKELDFKKLTINTYFEMLLRFFSMIINTVMISRYEITLLAAMSCANQIFILSSSLFTFFAVGSSIYITQALGAKKYNLATKASHITLLFNLILGIILFIFINCFAEFLLTSLNTPKSIFSLSLMYLKIINYVILIDCINIAFSSILRSYAKTKELMYASFFMNIINIILNALFLYYFELSLLGVAISSVIARLFNLFFYLFVFFKIANLKLYLKLFFNSDKEILIKILKTGSFSALENICYSFEYIIILSFIALLGERYLSTQSIFFQLLFFVFTASLALSVANEIIIARMIGTNKMQKAYLHTYKALKIALIISLIYSLILFLLKEKLYLLFNLNSDLINIISSLFYLLFFLEFAKAFNIVLSNALKASAKTDFCFYLSLISICFVCIPLAYFFTQILDFKLFGIYLAFLCEECFKALFNLLMWHSKKWQKSKLIN